MEFWLKNSNSDKFMLSVNPESFTISEKSDSTSVNVNTLGEVNLLGRRKLREITLASFFPNQDYNFSVNKSRKDPYTYVSKIQTWKEDRETIRVIIGSSINILCSIESFQFGEQDGTGDVYFTLSLKEYRSVTAKTLTSAEKKKLTTSSKKKTTTTRTTENKPTTKTYTVKSGDTLWGIAKKYYGDGSKYTKIYNANKSKIKNPNVIQIGWVLTIP